MKLVLLQILAAISALASAAATAQKDETIITEMDITRVDEAVDFELDENAPLPYPEAPMEWTGEVVSGAGLVTLEGSLEEIGDQIREINPQYFETDHSNETIVEAADGLNKRQVGGCSPRGINVAVSCNTRFGTVRGRDISNGLSYLGQMGGCLTQQANRCGRISCSYNSAIYNCAAGRSARHQPRLVADIGGQMFGECANFRDGADFRARGTVTNEANWSVLFRRSRC